MALIHFLVGELDSPISVGAGQSAQGALRSLDGSTEKSTVDMVMDNKGMNEYTEIKRM